MFAQHFWVLLLRQKHLASTGVISGEVLLKFRSASYEDDFFELIKA